MLVAGIILVLVVVIGLILIFIATDEPEAQFLSFVLGLIFVLGIALIVIAISENNPKPVIMSTKDNKCSISIETKIVNGKTVSVDTVYIFKKK